MINRIIPFSSVDGPGNRTAIFFQGCNFNCLYCHNPETINRCNNCGNCVDSCPTKALALENEKLYWDKNICINCDQCLKACRRNSSPKALDISVGAVIKEIEKRNSFISGVTASGGECTLQHEFLVELFKRVKNLGLTTFIDTNGFIPLYEHPDLLEVMDMAMVDVKAYDSEEHKALTGMDNNMVLENVKFLAKMNKLYEIRTVIVPELLNNYYTVDMTSRFLASLNPNIRYKLIKYRQIGVREGFIDSYTPCHEYMEDLQELALNNGCKNVILV